ncbi:enhanced disease resistance 2-like protein, partial [Tanacetum coccineum]
MEGWLYQIRSTKFGFQYSRKRYYVLGNNQLKSWSYIPHSLQKDPVRSAAVVNSCICVTNNGRKSIRGKVFYIFTLCGISSNGRCVKLGARNPEEAARWVEAFQKLSLKMNQCPEDILDSATYDQHHSRSNNFGRVHDTNAVSNHFSLAPIAHNKTADVSPYWTIFGCHNGLRLFKEKRNHEYQKKHKNGQPAIAAMSVIDGAPEVVFQILMSLGSSRSEWDFCFEKGSVIESIDGHTDIIHKILNNDWLPWGMKRRDLLLQRYWNREDDGTYCGGYVISPVDQSKHSVVRHMLDVDWKLWRSYLQKNSDQSLSIHMIGRLAALREFFKTTLGNYVSEFSMQESKQKDLLHQSQTSTGVVAQSNENKDSKVDVESESDEFFDPRESFLEDFHSEVYSQKTVWGDGILRDYKFTLPEDQTGSLSNSWSVPEPSLFQIRGETYFEDHKKITAQSVLMQTVAVDWLRSDKREDNLAARPGNIVQKFAADDRPEFFFVVNFQVPGSTTYTVASYYMTHTPIKDLPLLEQFVEGDDAFRNS